MSAQLEASPSRVRKRKQRYTKMKKLRDKRAYRRASLCFLQTSLIVGYANAWLPAGEKGLCREADNVNWQPRQQ
eukprot:1158376-Pelagomonas_calceolata.AAC.7